MCFQKMSMNATSASPATEGWYSAPNYRSTTDILWACLFTVFLCCWTAVHPDVPSPQASWTQRMLDRVICLVLAILAPENFVYLAFMEWDYVRTHAIDAPEALRKEQWSITHRFYAEMGGFCVRIGETEDTRSSNVRYLDSMEILHLLQKGRIDPHSFITTDEILDKGKADGILKAFTLLQVVWLLVQSIARTMQRLPLTTLEISALAYVPCAAASFTFWWSKPYDVGMPTVLTLRRPTGKLESVLETGPRTVVTSPYKPYCMSRRCWKEAITAAPTPVNHVTLLSSITFLIVGGIHLAAWNIQFPTTFEQVAWRVSSVIFALSCSVAWLIARIIIAIVRGGWTNRPVGKRVGWLVASTQALGLVLYYAARLYLLVEAFMALRKVPKGVYQTVDWAAFLPHAA